ncbi:bifunctional adenosylcobinamide kinase/adenosylcobinamide-phosphate guanylyltransferase [Paenibacillus flagellatus]|uniref:Adenosylcobinamide kinase n=1 Tax=Paenibacillus flagellatus TaxID=2211139 RepID=A0A2V5KY29_9BACL|nr:bifunctional adenosylcobinamide kinase/adenosylcobinamide-phosphate guanylyltransferase [Paenibacillus flagellatus]PYI57507.1 bifunctional adenosylcobinamide kinase/adenosylcobinamide-phosphate guanylyltransferase [Paenibacillus flagellatus]
MRIMVTGGARSGKSSFAERYAAHLAKCGVYIATAQAFDAEMEERLSLHRKRRDDSGFPWRTIEEPLHIAGWLRRHAPADGEAVLIDCLTLWLSNWVLRHESESDMERTVGDRVEELAAAVREYPGTVLLVTNEVGSGIVPEYKLGRVYRDLAGRMNQRVAEACGEVFLVTSGIPVELKRLAFRFD